MSEARNIPNLNNAQRSTGPRTEEGKAASSLNSLKHGLTAKTVSCPAKIPPNTGLLHRHAPGPPPPQHL